MIGYFIIGAIFYVIRCVWYELIWHVNSSCAKAGLDGQESAFVSLGALAFFLVFWPVYLAKVIIDFVSE